jgi:hypothetical protein
MATVTSVTKPTQMIITLEENALATDIKRAYCSSGRTL